MGDLKRMFDTRDPNEELGGRPQDQIDTSFSSFIPGVPKKFFPESLSKSNVSNEKHQAFFVSKGAILNKESKVKLKIAPDNQTDFNSHPALLEDGRPNFDCPCIGSLPHGPCGEFFKNSFRCWAKYKDESDSVNFFQECQPLFIQWTECFEKYAGFYDDPGKNNRATAF